MSLSRLPPELLIIIADCLTDSDGNYRYRDLNSLVLINRVSYVCLNTMLWKQALASEHTTKRIFRRLITCDTKNLSRLRFFLELGANIETPVWNVGKHFFSTPLRVAAGKDNVPMARLLLEKGASVRNHSNSSLPRARSSVMHAAKSAEMVRLLLDHGADLEENESGSTPLLTYTCRKNIAVMRVVLLAGAEVDPVSPHSRDRNELTPLHFAVSRSVDAVKLLVEFGADFKKDAEFSNNSWHLAAAAGKVDVLKLLRKLWPEGSKTKNRSGCTPLHIAAMEGKIKAIRLLMEFWPEGIRTKNRFGSTPLHAAAMEDKTKAMKLLAGLWPEGIRTKSHSGSTPLHIAAEAGRADAVRLLVQLWPEGIKATNRYGNTPLHVATETGRADAVSLLVQLWPEGVKTKNRFGSTPLHIAAEAGRADAVRLFVQLWPEGIMTKNHSGNTPLYLAAKGGKIDAVRSLVER
jgi:ankyrin repeat protein